MNNLAKLLQVPWMGIAGSCFIDVFVGIPYDPFGTQKVQVYSVRIFAEQTYINIISFSCICCRKCVVFFSHPNLLPQKSAPSKGTRQNGGGGAYLSACLGRLWREVGCTTSAYLDLDEQLGRLGKTGRFGWCDGKVGWKKLVMVFVGLLFFFFKSGVA